MGKLKTQSEKEAELYNQAQEVLAASVLKFMFSCHASILRVATLVIERLTISQLLKIQAVVLGTLEKKSMAFSVDRHLSRLNAARRGAAHD
ncbi:hypothetical protein KP005_16840 [Geomonas nitrogeniifigens]|uniref:Uncharacterized protein n=1 Tax=Geomonas diazotrophica TaxID=2843197 RepID=A0ABX8JF35_9BACT|nr:hypothetical protein [Geomonas nitrogeniifigens]QWV96995.1 hypothetical protein KP005_16840 [Geomonas nitrogeniifigens]